ncbi:hypothetical protein L596_009965 [Steinernema carpocapsae]|uniref:RING-type domain-containing protein n=1 Tax=Steinernema carpocapsae TaxID=34508 RepID=A0A4U5PGX2_STECR|nr:hypothetical protein L596_009965 [Steinernema carpocapsae]
MVFPLSSDYNRLIPFCPGCHNQYGEFNCPQVLPCGHTSCLVCVKQDAKKRCLRCGSKYRKFRLNLALQALIENLKYLTEVEVGRTERCEECDERYSKRWMRTCWTCREEIQRIVKHDLLRCHICLECCINRHNGHRFIPVQLSESMRSSQAFRHQPQPLLPQRSQATSSSFVTQTPPTSSTSSRIFYSTIIDLKDEAEAVENHTYFNPTQEDLSKDLPTASTYINIEEKLKKCCL